MKNHKRLYVFLIVVFSLLFLIPIWSVKYIPLQDWPVFMGFSYIISHFSHFQSHFAVKPVPPPYSTGFLLLAGLMRIFPPLIAGKILLSIYVALFFVSFYYYLIVLKPDSLYLYLFAPLLVYNNFFAKGNINFILSIPLFLFLVPLFLTKLSETKFLHLVLAFILAFSLYFTHFFTYAIFLLVLLLDSFFEKKRFVLFILSCVPLFGFAAYFIISRAPVDVSFYGTFLSKFLSLRDAFGTWTPYVDVAMLFIPFLCLLFLVFRGWNNTARKWKITLLVFLVLYLICPENVYTLSRPDQRILPFAFFIILLFPVAVKTLRFKFIFSSLLVILSTANLVIKEKSFLELSAHLGRCADALGRVEKDKSIVSIGTKDYYAGVINPFIHVVYYSVAIHNNPNVPSYDWNIPLRWRTHLPRAKLRKGVIQNTNELIAYYDYFFIMEEEDTFGKQVGKFGRLIYANDNIKLFEKI